MLVGHSHIGWTLRDVRWTLQHVGWTLRDVGWTLQYVVTHFQPNHHGNPHFILLQLKKGPIPGSFRPGKGPLSIISYSQLVQPLPLH